MIFSGDLYIIPNNILGQRKYIETNKKESYINNLKITILQQDDHNIPIDRCYLRAYELNNDKNRIIKLLLDIQKKRPYNVVHIDPKYENELNRDYFSEIELLVCIDEFLIMDSPLVKFLSINEFIFNKIIILKSREYFMIPQKIIENYYSKYSYLNRLFKLYESIVINKLDQYWSDRICNINSSICKKFVLEKVQNSIDINEEIDQDEDIIVDKKYRKDGYEKIEKTQSFIDKFIDKFKPKYEKYRIQSIAEFEYNGFIIDTDKAIFMCYKNIDDNLNQFYNYTRKKIMEFIQSKEKLTLESSYIDLEQSKYSKNIFVIIRN